MSDSEDNLREVNQEDREETQAEKKRRVQRACDICRKKKVKCDGASKENGICTNCTTFHFDCTYVEVAKKRGPPKGYVESVENRLERMEKLLTRLSPGSDFTSELGARIPDRDSFDLDAHRQLEPPGATPIRTRKTGGERNAGAVASSSTSTHQASRHSSPNCSTSEVMKPWTQDGPRGGSGEFEDPEEDEVEMSLLSSLKHFTLSDEEEEKKGFVGKSSGLHLITSIRDFKYPTASTSSTADPFFESLTSSRRRKYWRRPPWEDLLYNFNSLTSPSLWPPPDLIQPLVDSYFLHTNTFHPVLHRPTFEREFASRLYETDRSFAGLCLTVFALGARYINDPRVTNVKADDELAPYSKGWCFVQEFFNISRSWGDLGHLHGIQALALACLFVGGCSDPTLHWALIGTALRACLDLGLHRRHVVRAMAPDQAELHKRVFWILYILDRITAGFLGRPVGVHDEDIDVDYPLDVDDEFWECEDSRLNFKQPPNKPAKTAAFVSMLKLQQIVGYCLRTIYAINKSKMMLNFNTIEAQQHIVAELDSGLNAWLDQIPKHLKWDPHNRNNIWFQQSAYLYSTYYTTQILVHRPFIPSPSKPSRIGFPSLAICTNAARSGTHVIDVARHRESFDGLEMVAVSQSFMFGVVLLINVWGGKKSGSIGDPDMALKDVGKIVALDTSAEGRWLFAGKLKDILNELASQTNASINPPRALDVSNKRTRDAGAMETDQPSGSTSKTTPSRRRSTTTRKPSAPSRASAQPASEGSRPSSIHHPSPGNSNFHPSPRDSAQGSSTSLDRDIMNETGVNQIPVPSPFFSNNTQFSPDALDQSMDPLNFLPLGQNTNNPYGLPLPPPPQAQTHNSNSLPPPPSSINPTNLADFFPPTRDPNTLAQQAQFFAFLQTQNPSLLTPSQQPSQPQSQPQQQQQPQPSPMPNTMQQHGQLPFPHHHSNGGFVPAQQQQQLLQQHQQQQQQNVAGSSSSSSTSHSQFGFEQGMGLEFFNPTLALFGAGGGQNNGSSGSSGGAGNGSGHLGSGSSSGNNAEETTSGIWAGAPNGFEIDDWSSYLAGFSVGDGQHQQHQQPRQS